MVEEKVKEEVTETTELQMDSNLFDEAFDEAAKEAPASPGITSEEEKKEEVKPPEPKPDEKEEKIKSLEKQLNDTKAWGTQGAQKVAQLEAELTTLKKVAEKPPEEEPVPEDIKSFYEDYPEFKKAVAFESKRLIKGMGLDAPKAQIPPETFAPLQSVIGQMGFDRAVMFGFNDETEGWIEGHPDGPRIVQSKEFEDWTTKEKIEVEKITDPKEAIKIISRFKEIKVKGVLSIHEKETKKEKEERIETAGASIASTKGGPKGKGSINKEDYDGGWDEATQA